MQQLFSGRIFSESAENTLLASLTGAGLIVTLVLAAIILAAAVFAVISIVRRRKKNKGDAPAAAAPAPPAARTAPPDNDLAPKIRLAKQTKTNDPRSDSQPKSPRSAEFFIPRKIWQ